LIVIVIVRAIEQLLIPSPPIVSGGLLIDGYLRFPGSHHGWIPLQLPAVTFPQLVTSYGGGDC